MNPADVPSKKTSFRQLIISFFYLLFFCSLNFLVAGNWYWTEAWIYAVSFFIFSLATVIYLYFKDPALLNERFGSPIQKEQKSWDKFLLMTFLVGTIVWFILIPLDAGRFHWSPEFPLWVKVIGAILYISNFPVIFAAFRENSFAAPVVKMQKERGQKVISTGIYSIIRHPMYLGGTLLMLGAPLLLGSVYGLLLGILLTITLYFRTFGEEKMLIQELEGYPEYMKKVRWRIIPYVF